MTELSEAEFAERLKESLWLRGYHLSGVNWTRNNVKLVSSRTRNRSVQVRVARKLLYLGVRPIEPIVGLILGDHGARRDLQTLFGELPKESSARRKCILRPVGDAVDLRERIRIPCSLLNMNPSDIRITWGARRRPRRGQKTFRLGSYDPRTDVVRLHRVLDDASVPVFYIEFVIFHELIHRHVAFKNGERAARLHNRYFRELEASFPQFDEARAWEREHLMRHARKQRYRRYAFCSAP